ncbi:MAG: TolC family protein [Bryobacterales bacterium]|nr:TolC family protein [Bryobacterales bacterium]
MMRLFALCLCVAAALPAQERMRLNLYQAQEIALRNHPRADVAILEARAAEQSPTQERANLRPVVQSHLTGAGAATQSRLGAGAINNPIIFSRVATGMTLSQMLYDWGRTRNMVDAAIERARSSSDTARFVQAEVLLGVRQAYFAALRARTVLTVARETVEARSLVADQVQALFDAKLKSGLDLSFARVNVAEAQMLLASAENDRAAADAGLSTAMGFSEPREFDLDPEPLDVSALPPEEDLSREALENRPDLSALRHQVEAARRFTDAERALLKPSFSAAASAGLVPAHVAGIRSEYGAVALNISLPILNGNLFRSRIAEAELRERAATQRLQAAANEVRRDLRVALLSLDSAAQRVRLAGELVRQSTEALELAEARYELGLSSIVELSQAQLGKTQADLQEANARFEYQLHRAIVEFHASRQPPVR